MTGTRFIISHDTSADVYFVLGAGAPLGPFDNVGIAQVVAFSLQAAEHAREELRLREIAASAERNRQDLARYDEMFSEISRAIAYAMARLAKDPGERFELIEVPARKRPAPAKGGRHGRPR